jgi:hypothetical protein
VLIIIIILLYIGRHTQLVEYKKKGQYKYIVIHVYDGSPAQIRYKDTMELAQPLNSNHQLTNKNYYETLDIINKIKRQIELYKKSNNTYKLSMMNNRLIVMNEKLAQYKKELDYYNSIINEQ